jgi:Uma2 family endonuclease
MALGAPAPSRCTSQRYFELVRQGVLGPDDRVELLEGVVVSMAPSNARHESAVTRVHRALVHILGPEVVIRVQMSLLAGKRAVPEPDVAVVPGTLADYDRARPTTALLVVEVADTSLAQDRLTKTAIYAAAGIPQYLIVNLRDDVVEDMRGPDVPRRDYAERRTAARGERVALAVFPGAALAVDDLLPVR